MWYKGVTQRCCSKLLLCPDNKTAQNWLLNTNNKPNKKGSNNVACYHYLSLKYVVK